MKLKTLNKCLLLSIAFISLSLSSLCQQTSTKPRLIIPFGHQSGIDQTLFSPNNRFLITSDEMITIVSDVRSGKPLYYLPGARAAINSNSTYIATVLDTLVMVWNTKDGTSVRTFSTTTSAVRTQFHQSKDLLLVETLAEGSRDEGDAFEVKLWDFSTNKELHTFSGNKPTRERTGNQDCSSCHNEICQINAAWFTRGGDSLRLVYDNFTMTYALGNYAEAKKACFIIPGESSRMNATKVLNDKIISLRNDNEVVCFNEYGRYLCRWPIRDASALFIQSEQSADCVSPALNVAISYTSKQITLRDLSGNKSRQYEVKEGDIKKLRFNSAGTHLLVEFLNEAPRIFAVNKTTLSTAFEPEDKDYDGFPELVYETKTDPDAEVAASIFDSLAAKIPRSKNTTIASEVIFGTSVEKETGKMLKKGRSDVNSTYTNTGEIINLRKGRTISKIQSLIKLSGNITFSPDNKIMLLNTGKGLSIYSIPYARLLNNLKQVGSAGRFSPDSRYLVQYIPLGKAYIVTLATGHVDSILLDLKYASAYQIDFTANSKQVVVSSSAGGYGLIDLPGKKLIRSDTKESCFYGEQNGLYATVRQEDQLVSIFKQEDAKLLYSFSSPAPKSKNKQVYNENYRICFSNHTPSVLVWSEKKLIYIKDAYKSGDTIMLPMDDGTALSMASLSPDGKYIYMKFSEGGDLIYNTADRERSFNVNIPGPELENNAAFGKTVGKLFQSMQNGNYDLWNRGQERVQFSMTGDSVMACQGDSAIVYLSATGARLYGFKTTGDIKYFSFPDNFLVANYYGELKFYRFSTQAEWFSMIPFKNGETVFLLPDGRFLGSKSATRHLGYIYDAKSLSYKQFDFNNNQPGVVLRALGNHDQEYLSLYDSTLAIRRRREGIRDMKLVSLAEVPEVRITNEKDIKGEPKSKDLQLQLSIKCGTQYPDRLALFINGNPQGGSGGIRLSRKSHSLDTIVPLTLTPGNNYIEVSVFDTRGVESYRQPLYVLHAPDTVPPPMVYFAAIGAATYKDPKFKKLAWATKDVRDVVDSLKGRHGDRLQVDMLLDDQVTLANLKKLRTKYENTHPEDIVVIYYSGHGKIYTPKAEAFFGTYDMEYANPSKNGISIKDFNDLLENIPSRNKVVFLDACHSGELNKEAWSSQPVAKRNVSGPDNTAADISLPAPAEDDWMQPGKTDPFDIVLEMYADLYQGNGTNIIVSARGMEAAKECEKLQHGVFTYTLLKGINQLEADADKNAILTIGELQQYVASNVHIYSAECDAHRVQRAAARKENEYNDWALVRDQGTKLAKHSEITPADKQPTVTGTIKDINKTKADIHSMDPVGDLKKDPANTVKGWFNKAKDGVQRAREQYDTRHLENYSKQKDKHPVALVKTAHFTVEYERINDDIYFSISSPGLLPVIRIDVNDNEKEDSCTDRIYQREKTGKHIEACYIGCNCTDKVSDAELLPKGDKYYFSIPVKEMSISGSKAQVNFIFYGSDKTNPTYYPQPADNQSFKTLSIAL